MQSRQSIFRLETPSQSQTITLRTVHYQHFVFFSYRFKIKFLVCCTDGRSSVDYIFFSSALAIEISTIPIFHPSVILSFVDHHHKKSHGPEKPKAHHEKAHVTKHHVLRKLHSARQHQRHRLHLKHRHQLHLKAHKKGLTFAESPLPPRKYSYSACISVPHNVEAHFCG